MLQLLQTGKVLYLLAAICALGIVSKLVTSSLYKRLIKETGNMALTKNRELRALKQKTENLFLVSHGIRNTTAYIEKQVYGFRFLKLSLDNWDNLSMQAMILNFLIGGIAAFAAYWYRCDAYYIVLYGSMGILSGLFLVLVDNGANIAIKRQQLSDCLVDYVENSPHFYKSVDKVQDNGLGMDKKNTSVSLAAKPRLRELRRSEASAETAAGEDTTAYAGKEKAEEKAGRFHIEKTVDKPESRKAGSPMDGAREERQGAKISVLSKKKENRPEVQPQALERAAPVKDVELAKSIEQLRQSLEQIAAGREQPRPEGRETRPSGKPGLERAKRGLKPEDVKLLGELLQEYLT
ncbi:MAG: hypothetical protein HFE83_05005 [Lachnospiraceae bacterium]|jgi:hypothetical protein|nr:hypothetical protein [Lachnospiraceae bacterium]